MEQQWLEEETRDISQDKDYGSTKLEGKQETNQDVVLIESIGTRSKREDENVEQMSRRKKKFKRKNKDKKKKINDTNWYSWECVLLQLQCMLRDNAKLIAISKSLILY